MFTNEVKGDSNDNCENRMAIAMRGKICINILIVIEYISLYSILNFYPFYTLINIKLKDGGNLEFHIANKLLLKVGEQIAQEWYQW